MSKFHDDAVRVETIAVLDAVEIGVVEFADIFQEVARGESLDPQRAENLVTQCRELLKQIVDTRNVIRLSASPKGVH
jgi:hypothetical protein